MIKNMSLIENRIQDFSLENIECIVGFFLKYQNRSIEDACFLDIEFLIREKEKQYIACFRFYNPNSIHYESGSIFHQLSIGIYDISEREWGNRKYEVIDYEDDTLHFYCSNIEIIAVKDAND